jgi:phosphonoacetate hydrolase
MNSQQRIVVSMIDGFGVDYFAASPLANLHGLAASGLATTVEAVVPTVTNANNVSICCGALPSRHGITGNYYFNEASGEHDYMENADFIEILTLFQRARANGVKSALLTCKQKTIRLLAQGTDIAIAAEAPPPEYIRRYGQPGEIYSREINYWLWKVAIDLLLTEPDIGVLYVHTTDYPMHMWAPNEAESIEHMETLDRLHGDAVAAAPDAAFFITADHGMNYKTRCWDLEKACAARGTPVRFAMSAEKDRYIKHHRTFGGTAWVYLQAPEDLAGVAATLRSLAGVERVMTRDEAAAEWSLMPDRIGQLCVFGDRETVFGEMETEYEDLPTRYRSHGSPYEQAVPLIVYNYQGALPPLERIRHNADVTGVLFAT